MTNQLGVTFAEFTSRELPIQSAMCSFDCVQVLAEWIATLQDRVGRYVGIIGHDNIDLKAMPAIMLLEEEDVKLLDKIQDVLSSIEIKINTEVIGGNINGTESLLSAEGHKGYAAKLLRVTAVLLDKSAVWPVTHLMAQCLETHATHARARAEKSVASAD
jgi:hypothetical protein